MYKHCVFLHLIIHSLNIVIFYLHSIRSEHCKKKLWPFCRIWRAWRYQRDKRNP